MEAKKTYKSFSYESSVEWKGGRRAVVQAAGKPEVSLSSPPEFKGEAGHWTPEEMFVASLNACVLMTFVAFALQKGLEFASYSCRAQGKLEFADSKYRFTGVNLYPQITVKSEADVTRAKEVLESAHANCFISNSVTSTVTLTPEIRVA